MAWNYCHRCGHHRRQRKAASTPKNGCSWALTTDCRNQELLEDVLFEDSVHMCKLARSRP